MNLTRKSITKDHEGRLDFHPNSSNNKECLLTSRFHCNLEEATDVHRYSYSSKAAPLPAPLLLPGQPLKRQLALTKIQSLRTKHSPASTKNYDLKLSDKMQLHRAPSSRQQRQWELSDKDIKAIWIKMLQQYRYNEIHREEKTSQQKLKVSATNRSKRTNGTEMKRTSKITRVEGGIINRKM